MVLGLILYTLMAVTLTSGRTVDIEITRDRVVQVVSDKFLSIAIDTGVIRHNWNRLNFSSPKLESLAKALSPCYIRVGGSYADFLQFSPDHQNGLWDRKFDISRKDFKNFTMSASQWDRLNHFVDNVGWDMIFDLNSLLRNNGQWLPDNAKLLLDYTSQKGYKIAGWELGNEPNSYNHKLGFRISASQRAEDYMQLQSLLSKYPQWRRSIIIGPSTTQLDKKGPDEYYQQFLKSGGPGIVSNPTFHHYYINGRTASIDQFMDPEILDELAPEIKEAYSIGKHPPYGKPWLGETGSAYGGGAEDLSNRYVAGFMWLDTLGISATLGIDTVIRQSFYGGHYGLIDATTLDPNPDFWLSYIYKMLVGRSVLNLTVNDTSRNVRMYAHCTNLKRVYSHLGSITLYGMNLNDSPTTVSFPQFTKDIKLHVYMLQSIGQEGLRSAFVALNGRKMVLNPDYSLPDIFTPVIQTGSVTFPPHTLGFIIVPDANETACYTEHFQDYMLY